MYTEENKKSGKTVSQTVIVNIRHSNWLTAVICFTCQSCGRTTLAHNSRFPVRIVANIFALLTLQYEFLGNQTNTGMRLKSVHSALSGY